MFRGLSDGENCIIMFSFFSTLLAQRPKNADFTCLMTIYEVTLWIYTRSVHCWNLCILPLTASVYATSSGKVANGTVVCCRCSESFKLSRLMPVDSSYAISYYWLIVAYVVLPTVSEVLRQKGWTSTFSACVNRPMLSMAKKVENLHFLPFYPPQSHLGLAV